MLNSDMFGGGTATGSPNVMPVPHAGMNMYMDANSNMGPVRTPPVPQYRSQAHQPAISDTGPAAETLKQMAAQHQNQHTGAFGMKGSIMDPFALNDHLTDSGQYRNQARNGFPPDYQQQQQQQHYPGISRSNYVPPMSYAQTKPHPYGGNKPLTHYPHDVVTPATQDGPPQPSSLQQLQNQVAHFNQAPHMEITQTQHMQVSDGSHRMQMSQTQHVQMRQPVQNISLTQQQTFSMGIGQNQSQQYDPMNIGMMQGKMAPDQRQSGQMPYMNRPPPEYKMQHSNGMGNTMSTNGLGPNPLETMQNMVNQTNTHANPAYAPVKSENSTMHMSNGMMQGGQMSGMQQMSNSMPVSSPMQNIVSQSQMSNYSSQAVQRQTSYPGAQPQSQGRPQRTVTQETYTSAIMRNQRPPNVNIGPDGLNISQPRNPHDWPRPMMPVQGPRGGGMGMPRPQMAMAAAAEMMRYRSYSSDGSMSATAAAAQIQMQQRPMQSMQNMPMGAMQSQQAAMMQVGPQAQQMMMQQRMQMSHQQISQRPSHMAGNVSSVSSAMSGHPPTYPQSGSSNDDIMTLLDGTAPNPSTDFFDVQTSGPNSDTNWMDLDDILGTPK
ncbi:hypothetical protein CHS0354_039894 [Potamilus streckersoni]|uniref:Uncharacterized protein n=1 Tax=Potamilus streckersoni TaxID=2493646 RepID=A0AAE0THL3_9BIVA|nr:hypothetical protein CHS0354_039894 [Potamilus streckersoni]